jgi:uncharacterized protein YggU (UPF0235/DUF167 family)
MFVVRHFRDQLQREGKQPLQVAGHGSCPGDGDLVVVGVGRGAVHDQGTAWAALHVRLVDVQCVDHARVVRVSIRVRPGARTNAVGGSFDGALIVRVVERPEGGRATEAALAALASSLGVRRREVKLVAGTTSRTKVVEIPDSAAPTYGDLASSD